MVVLDEKILHIRNSRDGMIKLNVNNGVYTMDINLLR